MTLKSPDILKLKSMGKCGKNNAFPSNLKYMIIFDDIQACIVIITLWSINLSKKTKFIYDIDISKKLYFGEPRVWVLGC